MVYSNKIYPLRLGLPGALCSLRLCAFALKGFVDGDIAPDLSRSKVKFKRKGAKTQRTQRSFTVNGYNFRNAHIEDGVQRIVDVL